MNNEKITLADALEFVVDNRGKTVPTTEKGFPLIATNCISNDNLYPSFLNVRYVSTDTYNNWFRSHPLPDDIIITNKGSQNGAVCFVPNPVTFCIAQDMVALRAKRDLIYPKFLFAALRSQEVQNQIKNLNVDGVIPHFKKADFNKLKLPNPCYKNQKIIGDFYFNFCEKINLNNQINQTLESIAQALFKSWFIDFDPVRAKIAAKQEGKDPELTAMCAISGKSEVELQQMTEDDLAELRATASLFPDELMESELGEVPKGWFKTDLSILADLNVQSWTKKNCPEKVTYVDLSNTKWGVIQQTEEFIFEKAPSRARRVLKIGDTIVGTVRPANGSYAFIQRENLTGSTGFAVLSPKHKNYAEFIYIVATDKENIKRLAHLADGGAYPAVSYDTVLNTPCILPIENKDGVLNLFHKNVKEFYLLSASKFEENNILASIRDTLLPKLLSGELDVSCVQDEVA